MSKKRESKQLKYIGTSLIETLLYIGLVTSVLLILVTFYTALVSARYEHEAITEVENQAAFIVDQLTDDLRNTESIASPAVNVEDTSLQILLINDPEQVSYGLNSGILERTKSVDVEALNGSKITVSSVTFKNIGDYSVEYSFDITFYNPDNRKEQSYAHTYNGVITLR